MTNISARLPMMKKDTVEEITKKLEKLKNETAVDDEWENANKRTGLGYSINQNLLTKKPSNLKSSHQNYYKLEGSDFNMLNHKKPKSVKSLNIHSKKIKKQSSNNNTIKFVKRDKRDPKNTKRIGKGKKIC